MNEEEEVHPWPEGLFRFLILGRTTDGRAWWSRIMLTEDFIKAGRLHVFGQFADTALQWDEQHGCTTRDIQVVQDLDWDGR